MTALTEKFDAGAKKLFSNMSSKKHFVSTL